MEMGTQWGWELNGGALPPWFPLPLGGLNGGGDSMGVGTQWKWGLNGDGKKEDTLGRDTHGISVLLGATGDTCASFPRVPMIFFPSSLSLFLKD